MKRAEALRILREAQPRWEELGVSRMSLFGSVARDDARPDSDVDVLVEFNRPTGLFEMFGLRRELEEILGRPVDLGTPNSLRAEYRDEVMSEAVRVA